MTATNVFELPEPPPLPKSTTGMLALRKLKAKRTINDLVEDAYLVLIEDETFFSLQDAIYDAQAVEKDCDIDDIESARMIRAYAKAQGVSELANESLKAITQALLVVTRRYESSRAERRERVGPHLTKSGRPKQNGAAA